MGYPSVASVYKIDSKVFELSNYHKILDHLSAKNAEMMDPTQQIRLQALLSSITLIELFTLEVIVLNQLDTETYLNIREVLWESQRLKLQEEKKTISKNENSSYCLMFWLSQLVEINMYLISGFRYAKYSRDKTSLVKYKDYESQREYLINKLYIEMEIGDDFCEPFIYIFGCPPDQVKNQIKYSVSRETIYETEIVRTRWLKALTNLSESMGVSFIPYFDDYRYQSVAFISINFYIDFFSSELIKDILYPSKRVSPISCKKPISMFKMFRFLDEQGIILIDKEESFKLVRILFEFDPKYHARYPLEIPKFKIPDEKRFSAYIKSVFKFLLEKKLIKSSKANIARLLCHIFPYHGMSSDIIEKYLKPSHSPIRFKDFNENDLLKAMDLKLVKKKSLHQMI